MHKLTSKPITKDCFEIDDYEPAATSIIDTGTNISGEDIIIRFCEDLRLRYLKTKEKRYWKELIRWLPESWLQMRTVTFSYENLLAICSKSQRRFHKLNEWSGLDTLNVPNFIAWARTLPYAQELIFIDELENDCPIFSWNMEEIEKALNEFSVSAKDEHGNYRPFLDVINDLGAQFDKIKKK